MLCTLSAMAQAADCTRVAATGDNITHDLAVLFSTNALKNTIAGRGLVGKGPVKTSCKSGSAMIECHSSQMACKGGTPRPAWALAMLLNPALTCPESVLAARTSQLCRALSEIVCRSFRDPLMSVVGP